MKRFKDILYVDGAGAGSRDALERAVALAQNNQASLTVVEVAPRVVVGIGMPDGGPISADLQTAIIGEGERRLAALVEPYRDRLRIGTKVLVGTPFLEVIREVLRNGRDLVIKSPETPDWLDRWLGSDDMHLLRKCPCPVWLIKAGAAKPYRRILAAVDIDEGYPASERAARHALNLQILDMAGSLALAEFAELHIVHVWDAIGEGTLRSTLMRAPEEQIGAYVEQVRQQHRRALDALVSELASRLAKGAVDYLDPQTHLVKGWARKEIPALAKQIEADLIVMGTVGRTGIPGLLIGNTAETILYQIDCSALAIKPPGFETPIALDEDQW